MNVLANRSEMHKLDALALDFVSKLHRFLLRYGTYPLILSTLLSLGVFVIRAYLSRTWTFYFLLWNLFLAWIPYLFSLLTTYLYRRHPRHRWTLLIPASISIAFFPNAPYIVTDFLHLTERPPIPLWLDIGLLASFAWTGIISGGYALRILQDIVRAWMGVFLSWVFALTVLLLSGMGIYLGRFLRWNSWDLVTQPKAILYDIAIRLRHPLGYLHTYGVTLLFAALMFVCYMALTAGPATRCRGRVDE